MAYNAKTNWTLGEIVMPEDMNKIEQGIKNSAEKEELKKAQKYQIALGTSTEVILSDIVLEDGSSKTFIVSANNNGSATTINGKTLYKPNTTTPPKLTKGKAVTIWYDLTGDCFFIKASGEGTSLVGDVLAGKTFTNDNDTLVGTMPNNGVQSATLTTSSTSKTIPKGYTTGGTVNIVLEEKTANANQSTQSIISSTGKVLSKVTVNPVSFDASKVLNNTNIAGKQGTMPIGGNDEFAGWVRAKVGAVAPSNTRAHFYIPTNKYYNSNVNSGQQGVLVDDPEFIPSNILNNANIFGMQGTAIAGKRFASGTGTVIGGGSSRGFEPVSTTTTVSLPYLTINGLNFLPSYILCFINHISLVQQQQIIVYHKHYIQYPNVVTVTTVGGGDTSSAVYKVNGVYAYVNSNGFQLPCKFAGAPFNWIAIE